MHVDHTGAEVSVKEKQVSFSSKSQAEKLPQRLKSLPFFVFKVLERQVNNLQNQTVQNWMKRDLFMKTEQETDSLELDRPIFFFF